MRIAVVGAQNSELEMSCTHWSGLKAAFKRMPHDCELFCCRTDPHNLAQRLIDWKPDVVIYNLIDLALDEETRIKVREGLPNAKIVLWYTDCRTPDTGQITVDISETVDLFVTSNDGLKEFHKEHFGMVPQWVPQAAEPTPAPVVKPKLIDALFRGSDFIFIGGKYPRGGFRARFDLIRDLEVNHNLTVLNGNTGKERSMFYKLMPAIYGTAKFSLDISHFWDIPKYTSNRYWVIPAFWGFTMTKRFPDHELLVPETHHVYWDTVEELEDKMNYYREHEDERQEMIRKGHQYAVENHTYEHRLNRILDLLGLS